MSDPYVPNLTHPLPPSPETKYLVHVLTSTDPEQVTTEQHFAKVVTAYGNKDEDGTNNGANVYVGLDEDNQHTIVVPGYPSGITADYGLIDTSKLYVRGAIGDGVVLEFEEGFIAP